MNPYLNSLLWSSITTAAGVGIVAAILTIVPKLGGIGRAMAERLAAEGALVAVTDIDKDTAAATAAELGSGAVACHLDVTDAASVGAAC